jgi:hypothetical protein
VEQQKVHEFDAVLATYKTWGSVVVFFFLWLFMSIPLAVWVAMMLEGDAANATDQVWWFPSLAIGMSLLFFWVFLVLWRERAAAARGEVEVLRATFTGLSYGRSHRKVLYQEENNVRRRTDTAIAIWALQTLPAPAPVRIWRLRGSLLVLRIEVIETGQRACAAATFRPDPWRTSIRCPGCGREEPAHHRWCSGCGVELG